jgi:hypothetical protein
VRLVVEGTVIIIVPLIVSFLFDVISLLTPVFNSVACISTMNNAVQVPGIPVPSSAVFLRGREIAGRVPMRALMVVGVLTPHSVFTLKDQVHHGSCIQHCLKALNLRVDFFVVLG